jgi:3-dehydroquinate synthase
VHKLRVKLESQVRDYQIKIGHGVLESTGAEVRRELGTASRRIAIVSNLKVFELYGGAVVDSLRSSNFSATPLLLGDGERFKSLKSLTGALEFFSSAGLERNDGVVALGGGVVGDVAGFAAAVYMRGIAYFQIPTTLLAQIDSSVGGKTGINLAAGKNLVGAFHQPRGVIIDTDTLGTLPARELTSGWCEMVKNGAVGGQELFQQTTKFLGSSGGSSLKSSKEIEALIAAQCAFKASIVSHDEREAIGRTDHRSRRILNFGHTVGHALESVTRYRRFRHGEAVGLGMLVAGEISKLLGLLKSSELELLRQAVGLCGPLPRADDLDQRAIIAALNKDKKSVGGQIQWVLLERIGRARIVSDKDIPAKLTRQALQLVLGNQA